MTIIKNIKKEILKVMVGQEELIDGLLMGIIAEGHILVEGVPGLAKTTAINAIAQSLGISFKRVQFTPDLLPSDITGSEIYNPKTGEFKIKKGPIFTNLLLADEINRAPAKVQSSLLEVMQERQVTIGTETFHIEKPFLVMATQNPVEQEGAYSLPEAQLDRFMMKINVGYNTLEEEQKVVQRVVVEGFKEIKQVANKEDISILKEEVKKIHVDEALKKYMMELIFATRNPSEYGLGEYVKYIEYGVSPRASIDLYKASCAHAVIKGKDYVSPLDISAVLKSVFGHRLILSYMAQVDNITIDNIIEELLKKIKRP